MESALQQEILDSADTILKKVVILVYLIMVQEIDQVLFRYQLLRVILL